MRPRRPTFRRNLGSADARRDAGGGAVRPQRDAVENGRTIYMIYWLLLSKDLYMMYNNTINNI